MLEIELAANVACETCILDSLYSVGSRRFASTSRNPTERDTT
jgi:hypothetical protein